MGESFIKNSYLILYLLYFLFTFNYSLTITDLFTSLFICILTVRFHSVPGFDPWSESTKALADLIEKETGDQAHGQTDKNKYGIPPPGFTQNHIAAAAAAAAAAAFPSNMPQPGGGLPGGGGSKMIGLMHFPSAAMPPPPLHPHLHAASNTYHDVLSDITLTGKGNAATNTQVRRLPQSTHTGNVYMI